MATPAVPYDERAGVALAPADNAPLLLARNAARESLGHFWSAQRKGGRASDFSLKVTFDTPQGQQEHIWTNAIQRDGDTITGVIANTPLNVPSLRPGQRVIIDPARIYDWAYTRDGKLYGHFTSRVLLDGMPAAEAAPIRAQLSTTPLPAEAG